MFPKTRIALAVLAVLLGLLGVVTVAYAAMYSIDTNDASVAEWTAQGIAVFQTDPTGDYGTSSLDIVNAWAARSVTNSNRISPTLNFLLQTNATSALAVNNTAALAILDCDRDTVANDPDDVVVAYVLTGTGYIISDALYVTTGDYNSFYNPGDPPESENPRFGQVINGYVEWSVALDDLGPNPDTCQGAEGIRFATAQVSYSIFTGLNVAIRDETPTFSDFDIPTAVKVENLRAATQPSNAVALEVLLGTLAIVGMGTVAITRSRRR